MRIHYSKLSNMADFFTALKGTNSFTITAADVFSYGGSEKYPHTSYIVQIVFFFRSLMISGNILRM